MKTILQQDAYKPNSIESADDLMGSQPPWEHEDASQMLIWNVFEENEDTITSKLGMDREDFKLIQELVKGESQRYTQSNGKKFLFDIVSNKHNSFDLDKLDYLNRDLVHTGINQAQVNYQRIIQYAQVIDDGISYNAKSSNDIHSAF